MGFASIGPEYNAYDWATIKYDSKGNVLWVARYAGAAGLDDRPVGIAIASDGSVYVAGKETTAAYPLNPRLESTYVTIKYASTGTALWIRKHRTLLGGAFDGIPDEPSALALDKRDNVYVTGNTDTIKYDSEGTEKWLTNITSKVGNVFVANSLVVDEKDNVFITGNFDPDWLTVKLDQDGHIEWSDPFDGPLHDTDHAQAIALGHDGAVYVSGHTDYWSSNTIIKYSSEGKRLWIRTLGTDGMQQLNPQSLAVDSNDNAFILSHRVFPENGYITIKYDTNGKKLWERLMKSPAGTDWPQALVVDKQGSVYITGFRSESGDMWCGTVKYDSEGYEIWRNYSNGAESFCSTLAVDKDGNVYSCGLTNYVFKAESSSDYMVLRIAADSLNLRMVTPNFGFNSEKVQIMITGDNIGPGTTVNLLRKASEELPCLNVIIDSSSSLECTLDLRGLSEGAWDLEANSSDGRDSILPHGFFIVNPAEAIEMLIETIRSFNLGHGAETSLTAKLAGARNNLQNGNARAAQNLLSALVNEIQTREGKTLTHEQVTYLINSAERTAAAMQAN